MNVVKSQVVRIFLLLLMVLGIGVISDAQEIKIKSFSMQMEPMTVPMQRKDNNGNICALVKVIIPTSRVVFEGSLIGKCDFKTSEYWCYLAPGSKFLKVKYPGCNPLMVRFESLIGGGVKGSMIYELVLSVPDGKTKQGQPLKLITGFETPSMFPYGFYNENKWRYGEVSIPDTLDVYLNLKDGNAFDGHWSVGNNSKDMENILLGNVEEGDVITLSPRNSTSYMTEKITVTREHLAAKEILAGVYRKRGVLKCVIKDAHTGKPIPGVKAEILNITSYSFASNIDKNKKYVLQEESKSDLNGKLSFNNAIFGTEYGLSFSDKDGYLNPGWQVYDIVKKPVDVRFSENNIVELELSPAVLKGVVKDGKNGIPKAKIECKSLYGETFYTDETGNFNISGYINEGITVSAPCYKTLVLYFKRLPYIYDFNTERQIPENINIKLKKGDPSEKLYCDYDLVKNKVIY